MRHRSCDLPRLSRGMPVLLLLALAPLPGSPPLPGTAALSAPTAPPQEQPRLIAGPQLPGVQAVHLGALAASCACSALGTVEMGVSPIDRLEGPRPLVLNQTRIAGFWYHEPQRHRQATRQELKAGLFLALAGVDPANRFHIKRRLTLLRTSGCCPLCYG